MIHGYDGGDAFTSHGRNGSKVGLGSGYMHSISVCSPKMRDVQIACRVSSLTCSIFAPLLIQDI